MTALGVLLLALAAAVYLAGGAVLFSLGQGLFGSLCILSLLFLVGAAVLLRKVSVKQQQEPSGRTAAARSALLVLLVACVILTLLFALAASWFGF